RNVTGVQTCALPICYDRLPIDPINLSLRDASTQSTLRLLAQNYKVNMVVTDDVTGTVTLDFFRAPVRDVFQAILDASSLVCVRQDRKSVVEGRGGVG